MLPPTPPIQMRNSLERRASREPEIENGAATFEPRTEVEDHSLSFLRSKRGARDALRRQQMERDSLERRKAHEMALQNNTKDEQPSFSTATYTKSEPVVAEDRFFLPVCYRLFF